MRASGRPSCDTSPVTDSPAAPGPARPVPRVLRGILYMLMAATLFPVMNGCVKVLSGDAFQTTFAK